MSIVFSPLWHYQSSRGGMYRNLCYIPSYSKIGLCELDLDALFWETPDITLNIPAWVSNDRNNQCHHWYKDYTTGFYNKIMPSGFFTAVLSGSEVNSELCTYLYNSKINDQNLGLLLQDKSINSHLPSWILILIGKPVPSQHRLLKQDMRR